MKKIRILTLNIGNPSIERAKKQCQWLLEQDDDIFILTETKNSKGCDYISFFFEEYGRNLFTCSTLKRYHVFFPHVDNKELGVMIISKYSLNNTNTIFDKKSIYYSRHVESTVMIEREKIRLWGIYVPSRDKSDIKINRKKRFIEEICNEMRSKDLPDIIAGDLNLIDRTHLPKYSTFFQWEYDFYDYIINCGYVDAFKLCNSTIQEHSWIGRTGNGYRYDYFFVKDSIKNKIKLCEYIHDTRNIKISDHAAVFMEFYIG